MKKLIYSIAFLLAGASLHAMDDVRIVPYDYAEHGKQALSLFRKTFPNYRLQDIPAALRSSSKANDIAIDVTIGNALSAAPTFIGFILCKTESASTQTVCDHLLTNRLSQFTAESNPAYAQLVEQCAQKEKKEATIHRIQFLAIDETYRKQQHGTSLLNHAEQAARDNNCDLLSLQTREASRAFYERNDYKSTGRKMMAKPLNDDAKAILDMVCNVQPKAT